MNLNRAIIVGRVTADVEMRTTPSGTNVATIGVATNRVYKDAAGNKKESTEFHNVVLWRRLAEVANEYVTKGQLICVEGHLETRNWEGKDGVTRYRTEIIADNMQMGPRPGGGSAPRRDAESPPPPSEEPSSPPAASSPPTDDLGAGDTADDSEEIKVEDIPF